MRGRLILCISTLLTLMGCDKNNFYNGQNIASNYVSLYERYVIWPCNGNKECIELRSKDYNKIVKNEDILLQ